MGGVLNIVRKKVTPDFTANARISYGSWDERRATLGFGGKLVGPLEYRANINYSTGDGWRQVNANRFSMYGALGADMGKWGRIDVTGSYADDDYTTEIGAAPVMPGDMFYVADDKPYALKSERHPEADYREVYNDFANNYMNRKVWDVSVQYVYQITDWMKLKERFTYLIWIIIVSRGFLIVLPRTRYTSGIILIRKMRKCMLTWIRFNGEMRLVKIR